MFDAKCLIHNKFGNALSETALAWLVDKKERMIISNEINGDGKTELNGAFIKTLASGGDEMEARKLYANNQVFNLQFTMFLCCNTLYKPTERSKDCLDNIISFDYKSKFVELDGIIDGVEYYKIKD
jgi:phage/plasmid-associated DNA primase